MTSRSSRSKKNFFQTPSTKNSKAVFSSYQPGESDSARGGHSSTNLNDDSNK
jgi:hypothetical protein